MFGHAELAQGPRCAEPAGEVPQFAGGVGGVAEGAGEGGDGVRGGRGVVGQGVGQDDGVRRGVGEVEGAAEGVAELVVQRHGGGAEYGPAQPGAVLGVGPGVDVGAVGDHAGERGGQRADAVLCHEGDDR